MTEEKEKGVQALDKQRTPNKSFVESVSQNAVITQQKNTGKEHKGSRKQRRVLQADAKVYSFAIKCYDEQLVHGMQYLFDAIRGTDKSKYQIMAIMHNRDLVTDGIWTQAFMKPHLHIIIRCATRKGRVRVSTMLKMLGICFRPGVDDDLWKNHGIESIGEFTGYAMYLTHETKDAIADGKELYELSEIVSNLTEAEVKQVRDGYTRIVDEAKRLTTEQLQKLDEDAYQIGLKLGNFNEWYGAQPFVVRSNSKIRTIRESYERGVDKRIEENRKFNRVCLFIHGAPNTGKTYAAVQALTEDGQRVLSIGGGGSGKFDRLRADHNAIVVDDDIMPNLLNMSDNYICRAYKRNRDNPAWAGKYLIVTSNLPFDEWVSQCGIKAKDHYERPTRHYNAILTRFAVGRILPSTGGCNQLYIEKVSNRGSIKDQQERVQFLRKFVDDFNRIIAQYVPGTEVVDYGNLITDTRALGYRSIT